MTDDLDVLVFITKTSDGFLWKAPSQPDGVIFSERKRFGDLTAERDMIVISESDHQEMSAKKRASPGRSVSVMVSGDNRPDNSDGSHFVSSFEELAAILRAAHKRPSLTITSSCDEAFLEEAIGHANTVCMTTVRACSATRVPCPELNASEWALVEELCMGKQHPGDAYETTYAIYQRTAFVHTLSRVV